MSNRTCILILSTPRSGSSCTTGCLEICGAFLGGSKADTKNKFNEKGYFENTKFMKFNVETLKHIGHDFFALAHIKADQITKSHKRLPQLKKLIENEFGKRPVFAIKDPRILFFIDIYLQALRDLDISVKILKLYRRRESNITAIHAFLGGIRKRWNRNQCKTLYEIYMARLAAVPSEYDICEVYFEDIVKEPIETMAHLCNWIGLTFDDKKQERVLTFVERKLVHHMPS